MSQTQITDHPLLRPLVGLVSVDATTDLTVRQTALLVLLDSIEAPICTVRGVTKLLGLANKTAITRAADTLASLRLVARVPDPKDRRSVLLILLPAGRKLVEKLRLLC